MKKDSLKMSWDNHCMGHNKELDIQDVCDQRAEHVLYWYSQLIRSTAQNIILFQPRLDVFVTPDLDSYPGSWQEY